MTSKITNSRMETKATTAFKEKAHQLIDSLPESADWDDRAERARYADAIALTKGFLHSLHPAPFSLRLLSNKQVRQ